MNDVHEPDADGHPAPAGNGNLVWHYLTAISVVVLLVGQAGAFAEAAVWAVVSTFHLSQAVLVVGTVIVVVATLIFAAKTFMHVLRVEDRLVTGGRIDNVPWTIFK